MLPWQLAETFLKYLLYISITKIVFNIKIITIV